MNRKFHATAVESQRRTNHENLHIENHRSEFRARREIKEIQKQKKAEKIENYATWPVKWVKLFEEIKLLQIIGIFLTDHKIVIYVIRNLLQRGWT